MDNLDKVGRSYGLFRAGVFIALLLIYQVAYFYRVAIPGTVFDELQDSFSATALQVSMLGSIFLYIYAGMQMLVGVLADRFGAFRLITVAAIPMIIGTVGFSFSQNIYVLYAFHGLIALGSSCIYLCLVRTVGDLFSEENFTVFLSVVLFAGWVGGMMGTYPFERAAYFIGWRQSLLGVGVFTLAAFVIFLLTRSKVDKSRIGHSDLSLDRIISVIMNNLTYPLYMSYSILFSIFFTIQSAVGKKMLQDAFAFSTDRAAQYVFILVLTSVFGLFIAGFLTKWLNSRRKLLINISSGLVFAGSLMLVLILKGVVDEAFLLPSFVLMGLYSIGLPVGTAIAKDSNHASLMTTSVGFLNAMCYIAVALLMTISGVMLDLFGDYAVKTETSVIYPRNAYVAVLLVCLLLSALSMFASIILKDIKWIKMEQAQAESRQH